MHPLTRERSGMAKTTKVHFNLYKKAIRYYLNKYKITGWHVYFAHSDECTGYASTYADYRKRSANFMLTITWDEDGLELNEKEIYSTAKHEAIHLMEWPVYAIGHERYSSQEELSSAHEEIVTHLTDLLPD